MPEPWNPSAEPWEALRAIYDHVVRLRALAEADQARASAPVPVEERRYRPTCDECGRADLAAFSRRQLDTVDFRCDGCGSDRMSFPAVPVEEPERDRPGDLASTESMVEGYEMAREMLAGEPSPAPVEEPEAPKCRCCRCGRDITGHPQECPGCGWTVHEPVPPSPAPESYDKHEGSLDSPQTRHSSPAPEVKKTNRKDVPDGCSNGDADQSDAEEGPVGSGVEGGASGGGVAAGGRDVAGRDRGDGSRDGVGGDSGRGLDAGATDGLASAPEIKVGQVWRRKSDGFEATVRDVDDHAVWSRHPSLGLGASSLDTFAENWELISEPAPPAPSLNPEGLAWLDERIAVWERERADGPVRDGVLYELRKVRKRLVAEAPDEG